MDRILQALADQYLFDLAVLSNPWVICLIVPALFYMCFMLVKWLLLTVPIWLPAAIIIATWRNDK